LRVQPASAAANSTLRSRSLFLWQNIRSPFTTGGVTPSGRQLSQLMAETLAPEAGETVVEFGPGTGVFTRTLLKNGVAPESLILIEFNPDFVKFLRAEFPNVKVIEGSAADLPRYLAELGQSKVKKIISGLPLRTMPEPLRIAITHSVANSLAVGGTYVQFSYFRIPPLPVNLAGSLGLAGRCVGMAIRNLPPAFVYRYHKTA
jgi:phosphatidylethanolamine/phosphatidyl-N-methylethanolamine N-methyltransferase